MASLITKNTMVDAYESNKYVKVLLFSSEYRLWNNSSVELVKGKGVNSIRKYQAFQMAEEIVSYRRKFDKQHKTNHYPMDNEE